MSHMLNEIRQQPEVVRHLIDTEFHRVEALAAEIKRRNIAYAYFAARGTSDNAATYGKYVLEIQQGIPVALAAPSVFTLYDTVPHLGPNALVLGVSQSGAGPDVIEVVRRAREAGALTACITNEPDSVLAQVAEYPLFINAGPELSVAATKTYTGSLALFAMLSIALSPDHPERLMHLRRAADSMEATLGLDDALHQLVEEYKGMQDCVVVGRGYNQATALETALKLTETCYVGAKSYSAADFRHGPIALVNSGFPCFLFAPDGKAFAHMAELAEKLRAEHPALIAFAHDPALLCNCETAVRVPSAIPEWVSPLVYIVAGQLFAYWLSIGKGLDPDTPRGLTKVTKTM